jgi:hypothetical protein
MRKLDRKRFSGAASTTGGEEPSIGATRSSRNPVVIPTTWLESGVIWNAWGVEESSSVADPDSLGKKSGLGGELPSTFALKMSLPPRGRGEVDDPLAVRTQQVVDIGLLARRRWAELDRWRAAVHGGAEDALWPRPVEDPTAVGRRSKVEEPGDAMLGDVESHSGLASIRGGAVERVQAAGGHRGQEQDSRTVGCWADSTCSSETLHDTRLLMVRTDISLGPLPNPQGTAAQGIPCAHQAAKPQFLPGFPS